MGCGAERERKKRMDKCNYLFVWLFIYPLTHLAVSSLDNRMFSEYGFRSLIKKSPVSLRCCVGIHQEAVLVWRTVLIFTWSNWTDQTYTFQAGSCGGGGIRSGNVSEQTKSSTVWTTQKSPFEVECLSVLVPAIWNRYLLLLLLVIYFRYLITAF